MFLLYRRDYAEQGTCSPGDDVFGDEAVGAVVAGHSTGMHPVVASSLQSLRILEVNAQGIFSKEVLVNVLIHIWLVLNKNNSEVSIHKDSSFPHSVHCFPTDWIIK